MDVASLVIGKLTEKLKEHSTSSLQVSDGTAFSYGRAVGTYAGLQQALTLIEETLDEADEQEKRL